MTKIQRSVICQQCGEYLAGVPAIFCCPVCVREYQKNGQPLPPEEEHRRLRKILQWRTRYGIMEESDG